LVTADDWRTRRAIEAFFKERGIAHVTFARNAEDALQDAVSVIERDYRQDVKDLAESLEEAVLEREITDLDGFQQRLAEDLDSNDRVFGTWKAQLGCLVSKNDGYGMEEGLIDPASFKDGIPWDKLMYCAMEQDVLENLDENGKINTSEDDLGMPDLERAGRDVDGTLFCEECHAQHLSPESKIVPLPPGEGYKCSDCGIRFEAPKDE
jgi:hypothetical protein